MKFFQARDKKLPLNRTYIMGILNVTPDSFSDGGKYFQLDAAVKGAEKMEAQGADILDIGGQSTRPGYEKISEEEELSRLIPVVEAIMPRVNIPVSIDTFYPGVAKKMLSMGVHIINDITGLDDEEMIDAVAESGAGCIIMHHDAGWSADVRQWLLARAEKAEKAGIAREAICLDPGVGFGKSYEQNLEVIKNTALAKPKEYPYLLGASRKRVIGQPCGNPPFSDRLAGTIAAHTAGIMGGADIIRAHDVAQAVQAARVCDAIMETDMPL